MEEFVSELLKYNKNYDENLLEKAYLTAKKLHEGQLRKSGEPYIVHPMAVAVILAKLGIDDTGIAAGLLHDVVEDTEYSLDDLTKDFGEDIANIVDGVTKLASIVYESKEERQADNVRKMFLAMSKDIRVLIIKLADRLHNLRTINYMTPAKVQEKCRETLEIYSPLAARLGIYAFKFEMEDIAFKNLDPEAYDKIEKALEAKRIEKSEAINKIVDDINECIKGLNIHYEVYGRTKHYYSIYKKMTFQHKNIDEIFDLLAVRVIVDTVKDCYAVLGAVHTTWTPIPGRFKDYIAMPKPNKYQSLHTTVIGENGDPFEIQIRTQEMHQVAEYGIAAHWKYKEGLNADENNEEKKLAWLRQTLEWQQEVSNSTQFVEAVKMDLFSNQVFVFTPKGDVMELPAGSTPLDFAFKVHTAVGCKCVGAKVNGKMVPIDYVLKNGEIIDIITSSNSKGPSIDWLKIVKTTSARNKIRQYLNRENKSESSEKGKEMLDRAVRKKGYDPLQILTVAHITKAAKEQGYAEIQDLYTAISYGGVPLNRTVLMCAGYYHQEKQEELKRLEKAEIKKVNPKARPEKTQGVKVKGVDNLLIHYAKCCNPVPGDEIIGFTTKGHGVAVHRKDCPNMLNLSEQDQNRIIEVSWSLPEKGMQFDATIHVIAEDRKGLLAEASKICEEMDINIVGMNAKTDQDGIGHMELTLTLSNTADLLKLIGKFKQIKGVADVYRNNS